MHLDDALDHVREIRAQVLRSEVYRGYRSVPIASTGAVAAGAALVQELWLTPAEIHEFLLVWFGVAAACALVCAGDVLRLQRSGALGRLRQRTLPVLMQSAPALVVGAMLTGMLWSRPEATFLPGIWCLLYGLAVLSARPFLPRSVGFVAAFFLGCGALQLALLDVPRLGGVVAVPSAWSMGVPFGVGQILLAVVLHRDLEREVGRGPGAVR